MRKLISLLLFAFLVVPLSAQSPGYPLLTGTSQNGIVTAYADEAITVAATAIGFTAATINPTCVDCPINVLRATRADCTSPSAAFAINVTITGTVPSTTVGMTIPAGVPFTVYGYTNIAAARFIRTAGTSVVLFCTYSRPSTNP